LQVYYCKDRESIQDKHDETRRGVWILDLQKMYRLYKNYKAMLDDYPK